MIEMEIKDGLYLMVIVVGVAASHFSLRGRVMVLEERVKGYSEAIKRIFDSLERIEGKLDAKKDK